MEDYHSLVQGGGARREKQTETDGQRKMSEVPAEVPVPVKRGSVKLRSSFFEGLQASGSPGNEGGDGKGKDNSSPDKSENKIAKPKWMVRSPCLLSLSEALASYVSFLPFILLRI